MGVSAYRTWVVTTAAAAMILSALSVLAVIGIATWAEPRAAAQRELAEIEEAGFSVANPCRIERGSVLRCPGGEGADDECYRIVRDAKGEIVGLDGGLLHDHTLGASVCHVPHE